MMLDPALITRTLRQMEARAPEMLRLLRTLVDAESPSDDFAAVNAFARLLADEMRALGLATTLRSFDGCPDVVECHHGTGARPVMLLMHMDTVWPIGTISRRPVRIDGDRLYGPGSYDMKAGIVVALHAVAGLGDACPPVYLMMTSQEEVGGRAYLELLEQRARESVAVIGLEPAWPGGAVKSQRKGSGVIAIRAHGLAAHSGASPERGVNAVVEIASQIARLRELQPGLPAGVSMNPVLVHGGTRRNVIPDFAEVECDLRFLRRVDAETAIEKVRSLAPVLPGARLEVTAAISNPPLERTPDTEKLFGIAARVEKALGGVLGEVTTGGASEVGFTSACGVPSIDGFGADGDGAHAEHENVVVSNLPRRAALLAGTLLAIQQENPFP